MDKLSDEKLVELYLRGNNEALTVLLQRHLKSVNNFIPRSVGRVKEVEDLTQETFFKAWRSLKKFDLSRSFRAWLFSIARRTAIDYLRRKKAVVFSELDNEEKEELFSESIADESESIVEKIDKEELAREMERYLAQLSEANRTVLLLYYNGQLTFQEIAQVLGEPLDTVKSRHRRALGYLRKLISKSRGAPKSAP